MRTVSLIKPIRDKLSLGELRCAASCLETVLLSFLHSRVTSEEASLLEKGAVRIVSEKESAGYAVTDWYLPLRPLATV